jgi:hypothetical protein
MAMPGFTGSSALLEGRRHYLGTSRPKSFLGEVVAAQDCCSSCPDGSDCFDVPPRVMHACEREVRTCRKTCDRTC